MKGFHNSSPHVFRFWEIDTRVTRPLGVRTQEKVTYMGKHWFIRPFLLKTSSIHLQTAAPKKNPPFSPPSACCEEKKEWRDAIFSFSSSHLHPRVSREGGTWLEDKKKGGGLSQATWEQDISHIKPLPSLQIRYMFSLEAGSRDRCGRLQSGVRGQTAAVFQI